MQKTATRGSLQRRLNTQKEERSLKNRATTKIANKSDLIRTMLAKHLSPSQIRQNLEKRGIGVYPSEIYRIKAEF